MLEFLNYPKNEDHEHHPDDLINFEIPYKLKILPHLNYFIFV